MDTRGVSAALARGNVAGAGEAGQWRALSPFPHGPWLPRNLRGPRCRLAMLEATSQRGRVILVEPDAVFSKRRTWAGWGPVFALIVLWAALGMSGCGKQEQAAAPPVGPVGPPPAPAAGGEGAQLTIFHAASLARPFRDLEQLFRERHPGVEVVRESGTSVGEARKISDLGRKCDVYASADYTVVDDVLMPDHAGYNILFARERIVLAHTQRSKYATELTGDNWYEIVLRPDVHVGYANPALAPVGWRTLLTWKLADLHYKDKLKGRSFYEQMKAKVPAKHVVPDVAGLEPMLESLELDYAFMYKGTAMQHNLQTVKLPDEVDLGSEEFAEQYAKAEVTMKDKDGKEQTRRGAPCVYGTTIVKDAPHPELAVEWLKLLFSEEGQEIMKADFLESVAPPLCRDPGVLPPELRDLVEKADF